MLRKKDITIKVTDLDCKEFQNFISPYVDKELKKEEEKKVNNHADLCSHCKTDLVIESTVKKTVATKKIISSTPYKLKLSIFQKLYRKNPVESFFELLKKYFSNPVFAVGLSAAVLIFFYFNFFISKDNSYLTEHFSNNVFAQSVLNFQNARHSKFPSRSIFTDNIEQVSRFLISNGFETPKFPKIGWRLIGAGVNEMNGVKIAHVIYHHDSDLIYVYEAPCSAILKDKKLFLADDLKRRIIDSTYDIIETDSCTVVLSVIDGTFVSFVMENDKDKILSQLLTTLDE